MATSNCSDSTLTDSESGFFSRNVVLGEKLFLWGEKM